MPACTPFPSSPAVGQLFNTNGFEYLWDGVKWIYNPAPTGGVPTAPGTVTSITAGAGLAGGTITSTGVISLASPVSIANGGTGATTVAGAKANLLVGSTTGVTPAAGQIGEFRTLANVTTVPAGGVGSSYTVAGTLTLPPGDWDVYANFYALLTIDGGTVTGGTAWWAFLGPSAIPLANTDSSRPADNVAWIGGQEPTLLNAEGGTIGPIRMLQSVAAGVDVRIGIFGTGGSAIVDWTMSARRLS